MRSRSPVWAPVKTLWIRSVRSASVGGTIYPRNRIKGFSVSGDTPCNGM